MVLHGVHPDSALDFERKTNSKYRYRRSVERTRIPPHFGNYFLSLFILQEVEQSLLGLYAYCAQGLKA
jgi:hypothetical protein